MIREVNFARLAGAGVQLRRPQTLNGVVYDRGVFERRYDLPRNFEDWYLELSSSDTPGAPRAAMPVSEMILLYQPHYAERMFPGIPMNSRPENWQLAGREFVEIWADIDRHRRRMQQ